MLYVSSCLKSYIHFAHFQVKVWFLVPDFHCGPVFPLNILLQPLHDLHEYFRGVCKWLIKHLYSVSIMCVCLCVWQMCTGQDSSVSARVLLYHSLSCQHTHSLSKCFLRVRHDRWPPPSHACISGSSSSSFSISLIWLFSVLLSLFNLFCSLLAVKWFSWFPQFCLVI